MNIKVTMKSFGDQLSGFDSFIPSIKPCMTALVYKLINMGDTPIDLTGLNTIRTWRLIESISYEK